MLTPVVLLPADEHYYTPNTPGTSVTYENAKQVVASPRKLVSLYAFNSGGATVYLEVQDTANAGTDTGKAKMVLPVPAGLYASVAVHGGQRFEKGIYLKAYTDLQLTVAAGAVMFYAVEYTAYY